LYSTYIVKENNMKETTVMYLAVNRLTGSCDYFAVCGGTMASVKGSKAADRLWGDPKRFTSINHWVTTDLDTSVMVNPKEIWRK
jgi:hypothetical protein